jgi:CHASE2 domain-containing sensor protein/tRNA A-37 threonylcarbamoyl transferase component Bud32
MKEAFWKSDRFVGLIISLVFFIAWWGAHPALEGLEGDAYDLGVRMSSREDARRKDDIAVIAIDDQSIQNIGRWPWPRDVHANMVEKLSAAGAKTIASTIFYSEPQVDPGLMWIARLRDQFGAAALAPDKAAEITSTLDAAIKALDTDAILGGTLSSTARTVIGMQFDPGEIIGNPDAPLPGYVNRFAIPEANITDPSGTNAYFPIPTTKAAPPIAAVGEHAAGIGSLINPLDVDGTLRREPLVIRYYDQYFPSLALMTAARSLNLTVDDIHVARGESVRLGGLEIKTDPISRMNTFYYGSEDEDTQGKPLPPFPVYSFYNVIQGETPIDNFKGKIVLIGATAFGVGSDLYTPIGEVKGPVMILAHTVASILNQHFFVQPAWGFWAELLSILLVAAYLTVVLPRLNAGPAALASIGIFVLLIAVELGLMVAQASWLKLVTAATMLLVGHALLTTKRFLATERGAIDSSIKAAMSNRQLALQFQQKGELDNAFEYFRRCPVDEELLEAMYGLAADFTVKRLPQKAMHVYEYIHAKNPKFRDIASKIAQARHMTDTQMLFPGGRPGGGLASSTLMLGPGMPKTMLGRYEVEKELGKGAMGVVYLGKDPKINRVVAIKTMALSREFEADELDEVKSRFFREAETAGRLQHPNVVTIYDAGEEHDLAYIAMEFLEGHDLTRYTKPDSLLPLQTVMGIIFKSALALDYAHKNGVVHRDIKPANVMYEPVRKAVKLTDFGIARITDSSKTKTGMVLGTPSYMSPEQLSGKKVDGRSDLFSLGVMLYQMVTGKLPFQGESMATLMYRIANEPHQDIAELKPELAKQKPCLSAIINKALQKDVAQRYQSGADMARDIQTCAKQVGS